MLLYTGANVQPAQRFVTYVLISVALAVEFIQLCRIAVSDWTMVRLICTHIQLFRRPSPCGWFKFKLVQLATSLLGRVRKAPKKRYWKNSITQYSVIDACSSKWSSIWHWSRHVRMLGDLIVPPLLKSLHMEQKPVEDAFKRFIFQKLKATCSPDQEVGTCLARVYGYDEYLVTMECTDLQCASDLDMEDLILTWHIATTICDKIDTHATAAATPSSGAPGGNGATGAPPAAVPPATVAAPVGDCATAVPPATAAAAPVGDGATGGGDGDNVNHNMSSLLSGYCAYLLVSHPELLPLHPDIAKISYMELHYELVPLLKSGPEKLIEYKGKSTTLSFGTKLARLLLERPEEERWEILSEYWAGLLIYMAVYNKAPLHAECLTSGGEFISQVWALLGHMGCGEQSDTAVTKKKEEKLKKEKEEELKKRRREEEMSKEFDKSSRREWAKNTRKIERLEARKEEERNLRREEDKRQKASERQKRMLPNPSHA